MYKPYFLKREVIVFHQFQRKGYSLFACLGREVIISVLSVATLSASKAASISDEVWRADSTETVKNVWLGDVGVTGSRAPLTQSQAARMVTVLSHDDIAQAPVQSVNDLLKYAVGVDVRQRGALGSQTDISIRGGTQEQIAILLNGINICDPQTGHNTLDLPVQLSEIIRIEVLEGPAGRAYGSASLVGAINIVTRTTAVADQESSATDVEMEGGSYGYAKVSFLQRLPARIRGSISGSYQRSDGFSRSKTGRLNTDFEGMKAFYQGTYDDERVRMNWHLGVAEKGWGSSTFYASPKWQSDDQYEHTFKLFSSIQAETKQGRLHLRPAIYWNQYCDRYEGHRGQPEAMKYNYNRCNVYGIMLNSYIDWALGRSAFGAELRNEDLVSGNLGEPLVRPHHISGTDRDYTLGVNRTNISAHLEHNVLLQNLTLSAGFVAFKSTYSSMIMSIYPGIDASYRLNPSGKNGEVKIYASCNTSLRLPSFTEMYYKLQGYSANPHLNPEEMTAIELGAKYYAHGIWGNICAYRHHGKNMIDWIMDTHQGEEAAWQIVNHTKLNTYGFETSIGTDFSQLYSHRQTTPFIKGCQLSYSYQQQDKEPGKGIVSQYAMEYLKHKLVGALDLHLWRKLNASIKIRYQDRAGSYTDFSGTLCAYRPFCLSDVRLNWSEKGLTVYAEANNVLNNRSYVDYGNVAQPGIWIISGVRFHLSWLTKMLATNQ